MQKTQLGNHGYGTPFFLYAFYFFLLRRLFAGSRQFVHIVGIPSGQRCQPDCQSVLILRWFNNRILLPRRFFFTSMYDELWFQRFFILPQGHILLLTSDG